MSGVRETLGFSRRIRGGVLDETRRFIFLIENTFCLIFRRIFYKFFLNVNELVFKNVSFLIEEK